MVRGPKFEVIETSIPELPTSDHTCLPWPARRMLKTLAHVFSILPVAFQGEHSVSSVFMDLSHLSQEQFKELVRDIVDDRLRELLGDPDLGLQLGDGLRARLKESLAGKERLSGEDIADQLGLHW